MPWDHSYITSALVGGGKTCWRRGGRGVQKSQKCDDVIYEWSLSKYSKRILKNISIIYCWKIPQSDVIKMAYVDQMIDKRDKERERIENCIHTRSWLRNLLKFDSWSKWRSSLMRKGQRTFIGVGAGRSFQNWYT